MEVGPVAEVVVAQRMFQRRDTAANWTAANPILNAGEWGIELVSGSTLMRAKVGDGVTPWNTLPYYGSSIDNTDELPEGVANLYYTDGRVDARITLQKGQPNG